MNNKKQNLKDNLEDAYIALIMHDLSEEEGARLLAECERLNADPTAAVPESLHAKCMKIVDKHYAQKRTTQTRICIKNCAKKALLVAVMLVVLFTSAFATIEGFRVNVLNFILDIQGKYSILLFTDINQSNREDHGHGKVDHITMFCDNHVSIEYDLSEFEILDNTSDKYSTFLSLISPENGQTVSIQCTKVTEELISQIDTENADDVRELLIGGNTGCLVIKGFRNHVVWIDSVSSMMIEVITTGMAVEQTIALAESVAYVQD